MDIIPRKEWGAEPPWGRVGQLDATRGSVVHWEGSAGSVADSDPAEMLRQIQRQCKRKGYSDIFYNFAVSLDGRQWECRGWHKNSGANGTDFSNNNFYAICVLMGQKDDLTQAAKNSVGEMLAYIGGQVWPHSHFFPTACPGEELRVWVALGWPHDQPLPFKDFLMALTEQQQQQLYTWIAQIAGEEGDLGQAGSLHTIWNRLQEMTADIAKIKAALKIQ